MAARDRGGESRIVDDPVIKERGQIEPDKAVYPQIRLETTPAAEPEE